MNYKGCIPEVVAVPSEVKAFELEGFKASWYLGPKPDTFIFLLFGDCVINQVTSMGGRAINCSFLPPSMAVLGPRWLYEAEH